MTAIPVHYFLILAASLFATGAVGFLLRRNLLVLLMSIELMLNAVNLTLVAFNRIHGANHGGQIMAFFVIAIAADTVGAIVAIIVFLVFVVVGVRVRVPIGLTQ